MEKQSVDWRFLVLVAVVAMAAVLAGGQASRMSVGPGSTPPTTLSVTAPEAISFTDLDGALGTLSFRDIETPYLILVFSVDCPFCERNMINWRDLAAQVAAANRDESPPIVALTTSDPAETREYLARHDLDVPIGFVDRSTVIVDLGVTGYPTTLVAASGSELRAWQGVLTSKAKEEVLETMNGGSFVSVTH